MPPPAAAIRAVPPLLALAVRPLPLWPLQPLMASLLTTIVKAHPRIFERLGAHSNKRFGIDPSDLPFAFVLEPAPASPIVTVVRRIPRDIDVRISGPIAGLLGQINGSLDGDALFFSRDIVVEGDMEAALALRNAIDDAQIDIVRLAASRFGSVRRVVEPLLRQAAALSPARRMDEAGNS